MFKKLSAALVAMSLVAVAQPALAQAKDKILIKPSTTIPFCPQNSEKPECFMELKKGGHIDNKGKVSKSDQAFIQMIKDREAAKAKADAAAAAAAAKKP